MGVSKPSMVVKDIAIVVPTIRPELMKEFEKAWKPLFDKHNVSILLLQMDMIQKLLLMELKSVLII